MMISQVGFVCYKGYYSQTSSEFLLSQSGSSKAFGLVSSQGKHFYVASVQELDHVFDDWDYDLTKAKSEGKVPRLYLAKLPKDMTRKKRASNSTFIRALLPHILKANEQILADRERLLSMQERQKRGIHLRHSEKIWLTKLASDYRCKSTKIEALLMHVDVVPPSLALAQAILETGGGRSHAALKKNSTFGHMATKTKVQKFESLQHSVEAYVKNLNRHVAYASFRRDRANLRKRNENICGYKLASCLTKYSVRGTAYTNDLKNLIQRFGLKGYDTMQLDHNMRLKP